MLERAIATQKPLSWGFSLHLQKGKERTTQAVIYHSPIVLHVLLFLREGLLYITDCNYVFVGLAKTIHRYLFTVYVWCLQQ